ncbi:unnamed protein product [Blepharisma stoltei]|uniref:PH domain-containing protein n=1 Tax=Blepharisma stoltei TaxID=1481888 RepID=A0AAU9JTG4_9CILI|nr:unnamed protein product [Blepharisma stoltei]
MRPTTGKSTKQRLREDIAELDKQLIESATERPGSVQLNLSQNAIQNESNLRYQKIDSLRTSNSSREGALKSQLSETKMLLKTLEMKKIQENQAITNLRDPKAKKVESLKELIQKMQEEYHSSSTSNFKMKKLRESTNQAKQKAYLETMAPLESQLKHLDEEEKMTSDRIIAMNEEIKRLENMMEMSKEEYISRLTQRAECIAQREEAEEALETLKLEYAEEMGVNLEGIENCVTSSESLKEKEYYESKIKEMDSKLKILEIEIENTKRTKVNCRRNLYEAMGLNNLEEIENIEGVIDENCQDADISGLGEVILDVNSANSFEVDENIIKLQLIEIENKERVFKEEWTLRKQLLEERIQFFKENSDWNEMKNSEKELFLTFRKYRNRFAAISQWKYEVEQSINRRVQSSQVFISDRDILDEFKNEELSKIIDPSYRKFIENQLILYIQKLNSREKEISKNISAIQDYKSSLQKLEKDLNLKSNQKIQFECDKIIALTELTKLYKQEKKKNQDIDITEYDDEYIIREHAISLQKLIAHWDKCAISHNNYIEMTLKTEFKITGDLLNKYIRETKNLNAKLNEIRAEQKNVKGLIENLIIKQKRSMYASLEDLKNPYGNSENRLGELNELIDDKTRELEEALSDLNKVDDEHSEIMHKIEEEEKQLKAQQTTIENAIVNIYKERILIEEFENQFINDTERTARSPIVRTRSTERNQRAKHHPHDYSSQNLILPINSVKDPDFYPYELKDTMDASNLGEIPFEVSEKILGKQAQLMTERATGSSGFYPIKKKKYYRFHLEDTSISEKKFFERITPLLEGAEFYKKFSQQNSLKTQAFDQLDAIKHPPESCGYGIRYFRLHKSLTRINVRQPLKPGFESQIQIEQIIAPIIPQSTRNVLKIQKKLENENLGSAKNLEIEETKSRSLWDVQSEVYKERCKECKFYPFSIALSTGGRIELIAKDYASLKNWVNGINALVGYKSKLLRLKGRIESYTSV